MQKNNMKKKNNFIHILLNKERAFLNMIRSSIKLETDIQKQKEYYSKWINLLDNISAHLKKSKMYSEEDYHQILFEQFLLKLQNYSGNVIIKNHEEEYIVFNTNQKFIRHLSDVKCAYYVFSFFIEENKIVNFHVYNRYALELKKLLNLEWIDSKHADYLKYKDLLNPIFIKEE